MQICSVAQADEALNNAIVFRRQWFHAVQVEEIRDQNFCPAQVMEHRWGDEVGSLGHAPDVITGADVMYEQEHYPALLKTLQDLAAVHTVILLAFRMRGLDLSSLLA